MLADEGVAGEGDLCSVVAISTIQDGEVDAVVSTNDEASHCVEERRLLMVDICVLRATHRTEHPTLAEHQA